jgi:hypothetical protein
MILKKFSVKKSKTLSRKDITNNKMVIDRFEYYLEGETESEMNVKGEHEEQIALAGEMIDGLIKKDINKLKYAK